MLTQAIQSAQGQRGSSMLEALVAIVLFSIGLLGLIGLQAVSIKNSSDAKYRADAALLANQIIGQIWVDRGNIDSYAHFNGGAACNFSNAASGLTAVTDWVTEINRVLPRASLGNAAIAQIALTTPIANTRQVAVTICWQSPQETSPHNFVAMAHINL